MDQTLATIIVAIIGAVVSITTVVIQQKQDKVINKIDQQTRFIEKEKDLRKRISEKEKERELIIHEMMILILDTNLKILCDNHITGTSEANETLGKSEELKMKYLQITNDINDIRKEYELVMDMTSQFQLDAERS